MNKIKLSVVILCRNCQREISRAIQSVKFANEVVVVDDGSTDDSVKVAKDLGAKVISDCVNGDFAGARNKALKSCKNEWVLFLDADEVVSSKLKNEIIQRLSRKFDAYELRRVDIFHGRELHHGEWGNWTGIRLAKKSDGKWKRVVHEEWVINGKVGKINNPIYHYSHDGWSKSVEKIGRFAKMHAKANLKEGKRSNLPKIILYPIAKFVQNYIFKLGILDGYGGLYYSVLMSLHSCFAWRELWFIQKKK